MDIYKCIKVYLEVESGSEKSSTLHADSWLEHARDSKEMPALST